MIKASLQGPDGRTLLVLGLSFRNLDRFRDEAGKTFIKILGEEIGLPIDIVIFSGETEAHMMDSIKDRIGPETIIHIDPKARS